MTTSLRKFLFGSLVILNSVIVVAQGQDEYKKWLKKEQERFQQFKDERDKEFTEFLKREWKEMQSFRGLEPDETPKPVRMPIYQPPPRPPKDTSSKPAVIKEIPAPRQMRGAATKDAPQPVISKAKNKNTLDLSFFGAPVTLQYDKSIKPTLSARLNKEAISDFWAALSRSNYEDLLAQVQYERSQMRLNDWGYALLLNKIGRSLFSDSHNEATLFVWFMLAKSGYDVKVGYNSDQLHLLLPTENSLYCVPYFSFANDQRRFYAVTLDPRDRPFEGSLYTYEGKYPGAEKNADFAVKSLPSLRREIAARKLSFGYNNKEYAFDVKLSKDAVDFFRDYPQTNFEVYFEASPSPEAVQSLLTQLRSIVQGKSEWEAVNIVLRFVQTAFEYKTDPEQFRREKPLFPDETLFYPFSDCEDRAILFAYLVRHMLGLDVVALDYPGHIATAVMFSADITGDSIVFHGKKYIICDPTYVNADVGASMPGFKNVKPGVIAIH